MRGEFGLGGATREGARVEEREGAQGRVRVDERRERHVEGDVAREEGAGDGRGEVDEGREARLGLVGRGRRGLAEVQEGRERVRGEGLGGGEEGEDGEGVEEVPGRLLARKVLRAGTRKERVRADSCMCERKGESKDAPGASTRPTGPRRQSPSRRPSAPCRSA